ncbi:MAG: response regulator transcription factor [Betaproteobacteria bacterium]|nr:response regulator transcription factor [Betaproteobacteria bacterium]
MTSDKNRNTLNAASANTGRKITVLLADDHAVVREGLVAIIDRQADMTVVGEVNNGKQACALWQAHRPDVTLVDLRMPEMDGVSVISAIRAIEPKARILILTTYDGDEDIYRGMRAGAKAYLLKDTPREDLLACIRAVNAGETYIPPALAAKLASQVSGERLTQREQQILELLADGKSNKLIARTLLITEGTVKTHVKSILEKLGVTSRTQAVSLAAKRGLIKL